MAKALLLNSYYCHYIVQHYINKGKGMFITCVPLTTYAENIQMKLHLKTALLLMVTANCLMAQA